MPAVRLPFPEEGKNTDETVANLYDTVLLLRKELEFLMYHLDSENVTSIDADVTEIKNLVAEQIFTNVITSITSITNVLYATEGRIARLTVDHLLTEDILLGNAEMNYIDIEDQYIKFITATRNDSLPQVQYTDADGNLLYWDSADHNYMTTDVTDFDVMVYQYDRDEKMKLYFNSESFNNTPIIQMGIGDEITALSGKAVIIKEAGGLKINYYKEVTAGTRQIRLTDDGVFITPPIISILEETNSSLHTITVETSLEGISVPFHSKTKAFVNIMINATSSVALDATLDVYVDETLLFTTYKHFSGAYKDQIIASGIVENLSTGSHIISSKLTPSVGTVSIAAEDYRLSLIAEHLKANDYIISQIDSLEHDIINGTSNSLVMINSTHFMLAYDGDGADGVVATFSIDANYTITEINSLHHDTIDGECNSLVKIDDTHFILAYQGADNDGFIKTFSIDGAYAITEISSLEHDLTYSYYNSLVMIDSTHFILAYESYDGNGYIKTFSIDGTYAVTEIDTLIHDSVYGGYNSLVMIDSTHFMLAYAGDGYDGYIKTFSIDGSYNITEIDNLEHDIENGIENSLIKTDDTHFILAYSDIDYDGVIKTFKIE